MGGRHRDGQESDSESALSEASVPSSKRTCTGDTSDVSDLESRPDVPSRPARHVAARGVAARRAARRRDGPVAGAR